MQDRQQRRSAAIFSAIYGSISLPGSNFRAITTVDFRRGDGLARDTGQEALLRTNKGREAR